MLCKKTQKSILSATQSNNHFIIPESECFHELEWQV